MRLWLEDFRIGRELSQTLKLRRHEFLRRYSGEIDELYARPDASAAGALIKS